jgi:hypothetical protein
MWKEVRAVGSLLVQEEKHQGEEALRQETATALTTITATTIKRGDDGGSRSLEMSPHRTLSHVLPMLFFMDLKFVNNCKINSAGKITLNVSFHVVNSTLAPDFRWIMFPVSAVYFSG